MSWTMLALARLDVDGPLEQRVEQDDDGGAEDRAGQVGHATEDDDGEDRQGEGEAEHAGRGQRQPRREQPAGEAGQRRGDARTATTL